jgi:hypothetical protein
MNLSELINQLNIHKGRSDVHQLTNDLLNEEILFNVKRDVLPLLLSSNQNDALATKSFQDTLSILLFEGKKIKEISEAFVEEFRLIMSNDKQDELRSVIKNVTKETKDNYSKKAHKVWIAELVATKEQEAKEFLARKHSA